ncbi:MAG: ABC transporter substrate-binding protein [Clostridia bacterium]|nr:ABC transporter substrate-binding protein [Clostridia bacterium]
MKNWKRLFVAVLALVLCFAMSTSALALGDTLRWGVYSAPNGLFMYGLYTTMYDLYVLQLTQDPLFYLDESASEESYLPRLAESWDVSEDGLSYTFHLVEGVKWHDGEPFTAEDVAFTFISQCDARMASVNYVSTFSKIVGAPEYYAYTDALNNGEADGMDPVESVEGIQVVDDYTISVTLSETYAPFMSALSGACIFPKHIWESTPIGEWRTSELLKTPVGTGAYKFVKYEQDQYVEFTANEDYFLGAPKIKTFIYKIVNQDTAQVELINGDLDIVSMISNPTEEVMNTYADNGMNVVEFADSGYQYMPFNTQLEKLADPRIRQGITMAINRQGIVDSLLNGHGDIMNAPMYRGSWGYPDDLNTYDYDPEAAKALLAEAGVEDTNGDGKLDFNGEQYTLELLCPTGNKVREQTAVVVQQCLAQIGIDVTVNTMEFNTMLERAVYDDDFEIFLLGLSVSLDPSSVYTCFSSENQFVDGTNNVSRWALPELDELMKQGTQTVDAAERKEIYNQIAHILNENLPECWLNSPTEIRAARPELKNYELSNGCEFLNVQNWYFE